MVMQRRTKLKKRFNAGSLLEPMLAALFLIVVIVGLLEAYIYWLSVNETTNALTLSISETQSKLEEIRNHAFEDIAQDYGSGGNPGNIFNLTQINGAGVINITSINPELIGVDISVSCRTARNRIIGEDSDLDGLLDLGEDNNGNGKLDSPVSLVSLITQR